MSMRCRTPKIKWNLKNKLKISFKNKKPQIEAKKTWAFPRKRVFLFIGLLFYCKGGLLLTELRYEKWIVSRWLKKAKKM